MTTSSRPSTHTVPAAVEWPADQRRWLALVLLCLAQFMLIVDVTVVNVALPSIGADLSAGREALTWVVTAYVLTFGGLMLLGGRLADVLGRRNVLLIGLAVFTIASLASGLAVDETTLIVGRVAQGVGAALLSPAALSIITTTFHGAERNRALGVWAGIGGSGAVVGVLLGGVLTSGPGWEWVFFVNVPVGLAILAAIPATVAADRRRPREGSPDVAGALVVTSATALLVYGLVEAGDSGWTATGTLAPIAAGLLLYAGFIMIERTVATPLMRVELLTRRPVVSGTFIMLVATGLLVGFFFLSTLYLQHALGLSALKTGLIFLPAAVAIGVGAQVGAHLIGRLGGRPVAAAAFLLTATGAALLTRVSVESDIYTDFLPGFVIAAFGLGPAFVVATTTTLANVDHHEAGLASAVINTFHELGGAIGVAVLSTVAAASTAHTATSIDGFTDAFTVSAVAAAIAGGISFRLVPPGKPAVAHAGHGHVH